MMPFITDTPNKAMNPMAAETLNGTPVRTETNDAADDSHRNNAHGEQRIAQRTKINPQQQRNQPECNWHYDFQSRDCVLKIAELANPFQPRARRQRNLLGDLSLGFGNRAA